MKTIFITLLMLIVSCVTAKDMKIIQLLKVKPAQLQQLEYKVSGRDDVVKEAVARGLHRYLINDRFETYYFTTAEHPAHPVAVFRGRVSREDGSTGFDQRAWSASSNTDAVAELLKSLEARGTDTL